MADAKMDETAPEYAPAEYPRLSPIRAKFVKEYLIDHNGTQAALRAGYSPRSAKDSAYRNLHHPAVKQAIAAEEHAIAERASLTAERVIMELKRIAFADIGSFVKIENGEQVGIRSMGELTPDQRAAICKVWQTKDGLRIEMHDKVGALNQLGRHLGVT